MTKNMFSPPGSLVLARRWKTFFQCGIASYRCRLAPRRRPLFVVATSLAAVFAIVVHATAAAAEDRSGGLFGGMFGNKETEQHEESREAAGAPPVAIPAPGLSRSLPATDALAAPSPEVRHPTTGATGADETTRRIVERMLGEISRSEGEPRRLSLSEAVRFAVANNPDIRSRGEIPNRDAWEPFGATEPFDPALRANPVASHINAPSGSALTSGKTVFKEEAIRSGVSLSKLFRSGTFVDLTWNNQAVDTNSLFYAINPRYDERLTLSMRQPLLRNLWASDENTTVLVARSRAEESLATFEADLSRFVNEVIHVYWEYEQAAAELEVSRRSVALARELVREAEAKVEVGLLAPVAVKEALADAAAREQRSIIIENSLTLAAHDLQYRVMLGAAAGKAPEPVVPVEEHIVTAIELDRQQSLRTAAESRAEIRAATFALGRRRIEEKNAKRQRLWQLDLVGHYGLLGLAGDAKPLRDDEGIPIVDENGEVQLASPYDGGFGDSFDRLFTNDFNDYAVGVELTIPFGNARARANHAMAGIEVRRASRDLESRIASVALEVDRSLADVESAAKRVTASKVARELAEENLRNQTRRYELGAVTTKDVLDFQEKLAIAQAAEVRAITDHARAVTRLRMSEGTLLARFGIEIQSPDAPGKPWWYRF
jgi:outer membrane protein TolC